MEENEINKLIGEAKELIIQGEKEKAKALLIKAVRIAEEKSSTATGFEKFKYAMLVNQINSMIKAMTVEDEQSGDQEDQTEN